jgi:competence protein ComEC
MGFTKTYVDVILKVGLLEKMVCGGEERGCMKRKIGIFALLLALLCLMSACEMFAEFGFGDEQDSVPLGDGFTVYFIDVGQADSALIVSDGATMLIDGGNVADSDLVYTFLKDHGVSHLDYIVCTHAHEDHVGGLAGALNYATADVALAPVMENDTKAFKNFVKYLDEQGVEITIPKPGDTFKLGGANVKILGPINPSDEPNNTSIVMKITYGATSFLFTGDAERAEEADILEVGYDLSATVLKVGHHGSSTSTTYPFLREIMPQYAVISCETGNSYGHPHEETLSKLRDADVTLYRTDLQGTITCASDGKTVSFTTERNAAVPTNPTVTSTADYYIGNVNSHVLHSPDCNSLPLEKNRVLFDTLAEALAEGYVKHKTCLQFE